VTDVHAAAGSYAVDALSPGERLEFEAHLVGCAGCQQEVAEFAETLAELSPLSAATPPASLRASVLAAVSGGQVSGRRLAATNGHANGHASNGGSEAAPRRALPAQVTELRPLGPDEVAPLEEHPSVLPEQPWLDVAAALSDDGGGGRRERRRDWLLGAVVAAALVVALVLSGWVYVSWEQSQRRVVQQQRETALLTAPDARVYSPTGSAEGIRVSLVVSRERDEALFLGDDLRDPGRDRVYQLWTIKGGRPVSAGLVREGGDVRQWVTLSSDITGFALSSEPGPRGSETPTDELVGVTLSNP
jgi:hypothetical protein